MPRIGLDLKTILQAATVLADKEGLDAVTLASLAKKLNIRPPSLYNHVEGLGGLRKKLAVHGLEVLYDRLAKASIGKSKDEAVHSLSDAYIEFAREHPGIYELTLHSSDQEDQELQRVSRKIVELIVQILSGYGLEDDESIHAVRGLRSILHGFSSLEQKGGFGLPLNTDKSLHLLIDSYLAGIHKMKQK
ncbi:MAG TPA: WHG domain-containing protein [Metabacillus sp.]|nr:WHG domain-containing protein [Metabacillus sp.]